MEDLSPATLNEMISEAIVNAFDHDEQITGFYHIIDENLALPFTTAVLDRTVTVEGITYGKDGGLVAIYANGTQQGAIALEELPLPSPPPRGAEWIAAYRHWTSSR